jgi:hypothetical protein
MRLHCGVDEGSGPTLLLVWGERDSRFQVQRCFSETHLPRLEGVGVDAGHAVTIEAADAFDAAVTDFPERAGALAREDEGDCTDR